MKRRDQSDQSALKGWMDLNRNELVGTLLLAGLAVLAGVFTYP